MGIWGNAMDRNESWCLFGGLKHQEQGIWDHERSVKLADHGTGFLEQGELMELMELVFFGQSMKHVETC